MVLMYFLGSGAKEGMWRNWEIGVLGRGRKRMQGASYSSEYRYR